MATDTLFLLSSRPNGFWLVVGRQNHVDWADSAQLREPEIAYILLGIGLHMPLRDKSGGNCDGQSASATDMPNAYVTPQADRTVPEARYIATIRVFDSPEATQVTASRPPSGLAAGESVRLKRRGRLALRRLGECAPRSGGAQPGAGEGGGTSGRSVSEESRWFRPFARPLAAAAAAHPRPLSAWL